MHNKLKDTCDEVASAIQTAEENLRIFFFERLTLLYWLQKEDIKDVALKPAVQNNAAVVREQGDSLSRSLTRATQHMRESLSAAQKTHHSPDESALSQTMRRVALLEELIFFRKLLIDFGCATQACRDCCNSMIRYYLRKKFSTC